MKKSIESKKMDKLDRAYEGSWYTITGCGGSLDDWKNGYADIMQKNGIGTPKEWIHFTGAEMNDKYNLMGDCKYPDDLNFLAFSNDGLNIGKLAMFKMAMQDRWFDDIVDNNAWRNER